MNKNKKLSDSVLPNLHPKEILLEKFLIPKSISVRPLSEQTHLSQEQLSRIFNKPEGIPPKIAAGLACCFGTPQNFWLHLQKGWDQEERKRMDAPAGQ